MTTPIERATQALSPLFKQRFDPASGATIEESVARAVFESIDTGGLARALIERGWEDIESPFEDLYGIDFDGIAQAVKNHLTGESE